jgi:LmbE family N-acetylglucosaminyl deacetylase
MSSAKRILVVAPHADDESIGCGGTLVRLHRAGARLTIALLTRPEPFAIRRPEHAAALARLGAVQVIELGYLEQHLPVEPPAVAALHRVVHDADAALVLAPHPGEMDRDHRAANRLVHAALAMRAACGGALPALWEYEVWSAIAAPDLVVDITAVADDKRAAVRCYRSQLAERDHEGGALGLNAYRATTLGTGHGYAEAFAIPAVCDQPQEAACIRLA